MNRHDRGKDSPRDRTVKSAPHPNYGSINRDVDVTREGNWEGKQLGKELNLLHMVSFVVGEIIGSGIFVSPYIALKYSGSAGLSLVAWGVGGLLALLGGLCYAELGTLLDKSGGEYTIFLEAYSFREFKKPWLECFGSLMAFLYAWATIFVIRPASSAIVCLTVGSYLARPFYLGCDIPPYVVQLLAMASITLYTILQCSSVRWTARTMTFLSSVKLLACLLVVAGGAGYLIAGGSTPEEIRHPFAGSTTRPASIALSLYGVLWAYEGWNAPNNFIEEQHNAARDLPRSIYIGTSIVVVSYLLVNLAFLAVLPYNEIVGTEAVALVFANKIAGKAGMSVICILVSLAAFGAAIGNHFGGVRVITTAARDGLLPDFLSGVHSTLRTPVAATVFLSVLSCIAVMVGNLETLINGESASGWVIYALAYIAVLILRVTRRRAARPFKVWIVVPIFMSVASVLLVVVPLWQEPWPSLTAFGVMACGIPVYIVLVMEAPRRLRPKVLDTLSGHVSTFTNNLLNTESSR